MKIGFVVNDIETEQAQYTTNRLALAAKEMGHEAWYMGIGDFAYELDGSLSTKARAGDAKSYRSLERHLADDLTGFLAGHGLTIDDIGVWVSHPGGPKVIEAINDALVLPDEALELTWRSLSEVGNLSSSSVLHVLRDTLAKPPASDSPGLLMAMGPGFCAELVLLRWH